jgi:hypothetical protein
MKAADERADFQTVSALRGPNRMIIGRVCGSR